MIPPSSRQQLCNFVQLAGRWQRVPKKAVSGGVSMNNLAYSGAVDWLIRLGNSRHTSNLQQPLEKRMEGQKAWYCILRYFLSCFFP